MSAFPAAGRRLRPVPALAAAVFAVSTVLFTILWMISVRPAPDVEIGFQNRYLPGPRAEGVDSVVANSPAERAGLLPGDRIVALNGLRIADSSTLYKVWRRHKPGDLVRLTVERPGSAALLQLTSEFRRRSSGRLEGFAAGVRNSYPVPFVLVGLAVLFLRVEDRHAWLLALLFAGFIAAPGFPNGTGAFPPPLHLFAVAYQMLFVALLGPLFYFFFAVFPARSPLERRWPWLKWAAVAAGLSLVVPGVRSGALQLPPPLSGWVGTGFSQAFGRWFAFATLGLGLISLAANFARARDAEARRKIRVIFWGTAVGVAPAALLRAFQTFTGSRGWEWLDTATTALLFLFPLSFAYAVIKHRVLEIPVLLQRSARYLLVQRGFTFLLSLLSIGLTLLFAFSFSGYVKAAGAAAQPSGITLGAVFGTALLWGGSQVHRRVSGRIDRAFFRSAYDARVILEDLAEKTRTITDRGDLARLLEHHIRRALQPQVLTIHLAGTSASAPVDVDFQVPIPGRSGQPLGMLVLGPRLSEEPYSGEDKRLLASVASQAGTALDNIRLGEEIAERIESERRAAREMEIASEVQTRLLPQRAPELGTLDCAGRCIQARSVGGDYYDFLDLGPDKTGFVLADVSGKGVHAALLMANLQAQLRSQCGVAPLDPVRLLREVNRSLWQSTAAQHYATLFFAIYDDSARRLAYINCGHNPPLLVRSGGAVERLEATSTVIGLFEHWTGLVQEIRLAPGDLLAVFSDGVTEAARGEQEFGEARLLEELRVRNGLPAKEIVAAILRSVQEFSAGEQSDDLTLLIARART